MSAGPSALPHGVARTLGVTSPAWLVGRSAGPVIRACLTRARCPVVVIDDVGGMPVSAGQAPVDAAAS